MIYRVKFNTRGGFWMIQISHVPFIWTTIRQRHALAPEAGAKPPVLKVHEFPTIHDAIDYLKLTGIDQIYQRMATPRDYYEKDGHQMEESNTYPWIMSPLRAFGGTVRPFQLPQHSRSSS